MQMHVHTAHTINTQTIKEAKDAQAKKTKDQQ